VAASRAERLAIFFERLANAPAATTAEEAKTLMDRLLNTVEDELSGVAFDPSTRGADGRLYPAQEDARFAVAGREDLTGYAHRRHDTYIGRAGAILIRSRVDGTVLVNKPGGDGVFVELDDGA
jgi:hypothetical protein